MRWMWMEKKIQKFMHSDINSRPFLSSAFLSLEELPFKKIFINTTVARLISLK